MMTYLLPVVFVVVGCKRNPPAAAAADSTADNVATSASIAAAQAALQELQQNFMRVHFALDSATLTREAQDALQSNVGILQAYPRIRVEIQGHADERGTVDYNLALGQRRARTVLGFLQTHGVAGSRLSVVSYGEERPLERGATEVAWAKNRRAEFRVIEGGGAGGTVD